MPHYDLPLEQLRSYRTSVPEPEGLDAFWSRALEAARAAAAAPVLERYASDVYGRLDAWDVTFSGADGDPIKAWYLRPAPADDAALPCRVAFVGYGGGRNLPVAHTLYPACGIATLVMDNRAQGGSSSGGATGDPGAGASGPEFPGVMTRGVMSPETYYYRRLFVDAVRAVETAASLPGVDAARIGVAGGSQGGALALAAAALVPELVALCHADLPFLCDIERGMELAPDPPYTELVRFLAVNPQLEDAVRNTVRHVDTALLARRIRSRTLVAVGLNDTVCPPSTVFAAFNAIDAEKEIAVFPFAGHVAPSTHIERQLADFVRQLV